MKLKSIYKYLVCQSGKSYLIFVGILLAIMHIGLFITVLLESNGGIGGMEMATLTYMLVSGIVIYRESLSVSMQNGISRRTFFIGSILTFITISLIASAGDVVINLLGNTYEKHCNMIYDSMYEQFFMKGFYDENVIVTPALSDYFKIFIFDFIVYITVSTIGLTISVILYRLSKALKIIIPIGFLFICQILSVVIPYIDYKFFDNKFMNKLIPCLQWMVESIYHLMAVISCAAVIFIFISFLFIRRVPLNDSKK